MHVALGSPLELCTAGETPLELIAAVGSPLEITLGAPLVMVQGVVRACWVGACQAVVMVGEPHKPLWLPAPVWEGRGNLL